MANICILYPISKREFKKMVNSCSYTPFLLIPTSFLNCLKPLTVGVSGIRGTLLNRYIWLTTVLRNGALSHITPSLHVKVALTATKKH